ncbi:MAG: hypothetical protein M1289_02070 [Patescibacteria group bacterium]|nr:hypothetical protein [Patescibacteria group bacterium]
MNWAEVEQSARAFQRQKQAREEALRLDQQQREEERAASEAQKYQAELNVITVPLHSNP